MARDYCPLCQMRVGASVVYPVCGKCGTTLVDISNSPASSPPFDYCSFCNIQNGPCISATCALCGNYLQRIPPGVQPRHYTGFPPAPYSFVPGPAPQPHCNVVSSPHDFSFSMTVTLMRCPGGCGSEIQLTGELLRLARSEDDPTTNVTSICPYNCKVRSALFNKKVDEAMKLAAKRANPIS